MGVSTVVFGGWRRVDDWKTPPPASEAVRRVMAQLTTAAGGAGWRRHVSASHTAALPGERAGGTAAGQAHSAARHSRGLPPSRRPPIVGPLAGPPRLASTRRPSTSRPSTRKNRRLPLTRSNVACMAWAGVPGAANGGTSLPEIDQSRVGSAEGAVGAATRPPHSGLPRHRERPNPRGFREPHMPKDFTVHICTSTENPQQMATTTTRRPLMSRG